MKPIHERIDTRPKLEPIPQRAGNGIDWWAWGWWDGWWSDESLKKTTEELRKILEETEKQTEK